MVVPLEHKNRGTFNGRALHHLSIHSPELKGAMKISTTFLKVFIMTLVLCYTQVCAMGFKKKKTFDYENLVANLKKKVKAFNFKGVKNILKKCEESPQCELKQLKHDAGALELVKAAFQGGNIQDLKQLQLLKQMIDILELPITISVSLIPPKEPKLLEEPKTDEAEQEFVEETSELTAAEKESFIELFEEPKLLEEPKTDEAAEKDAKTAEKELLKLLYDEEEEKKKKLELQKEEEKRKLELQKEEEKKKLELQKEEEKKKLELQQEEEKKKLELQQEKKEKEEKLMKELDQQKRREWEEMIRAQDQPQRLRKVNQEMSEKPPLNQDHKKSKTTPTLTAKSTYSKKKKATKIMQQGEEKRRVEENRWNDGDWYRAEDVERDGFGNERVYEYWYYVPTGHYFNPYDGSRYPDVVHVHHYHNPYDQQYQMPPVPNLEAAESR